MGDEREVDIAQYSRVDAGAACRFFLAELGESHGEVDGNTFSDVRAKLMMGV